MASPKKMNKLNIISRLDNINVNVNVNNDADEQESFKVKESNWNENNKSIKSMRNSVFSTYTIKDQLEVKDQLMDYEEILSKI